LRRLPVNPKTSHYTITKHRPARRITIRRSRCPVETIDCASKSECLRRTRKLSDDGLVGIVVDAEPSPRVRYEQPRRKPRL
jgi:hypothetical protein